jgi:D-alanyl-D-alanine carboxypeptidase/D-alanyl-D-alanine-endopeptidase (penicillin-binding protein 4)
MATSCHVGVFMKNLGIKKLIALSSLALIPQAFSQSALDKKWTQAITASFGKDTKLQQAYCYVDDKGQVAGVNTNKLISIASVSKVFTSLWALDRLGQDFKYETKIFIKDKVAHIQGGFDPAFGSAKLFLIATELNKLGVTSINTLTFDRNLYVHPFVITDSDYEAIFKDADGVLHSKHFTSTIAETKKHLTNYLGNTAAWPAFVKKEFNTKNAAFKVIPDKIKLSIKEISHNNANPFVVDGKYVSGVKIISFKSDSLTKILKLMNSDSNNGLADLIFQGLGGAPALNKYFSEKLGFDTTQMKFHSGSGLPYTKSKDGKNISRVENQATCQSILKVLDMLALYTDKSLPSKFSNFVLPDYTCSSPIAKEYMPVGGVEGTIKSRFAQAATIKTLVAKSGTLSNFSALAGTISTHSGKRHFAVINGIAKYSASALAKKVQNTMVLAMIKEFSGAEKFPYTPVTHTNKYFFLGADLSTLKTVNTK